MTYEISIDIGGTFTDLFIRREGGETDSFKVPTTPEDPTEGFFDALEKAADEYGMTLEALLGDADRVIHGTTISTNAIIEDTGAKTALLCTEGFRNTLLLREGGKEDPFDWDIPYPEPYIPRSLTFEVTERINSEGEVVTELDEQQAQEVIEAVVDADVEAVAVAFLWSHANPEHEQRIGELLEEHAPDLTYSLSHEVNPMIREYRRTSSTAIDASVADLVGEYLESLEAKLLESGYEGEPLIISSNGGVMPVEEITRTPIWTVDAGPTTLPVAAETYTRAELGRDDVIAVDMGGTSLDMAVVREGYTPRTREAAVGDDHMLGIEKVDVTSVGSGGGSIAWVDQGGLLHVGPESAGSDPGPVCYLRGGERPTFTDAAMVLGYLSEEYFLGGEMEVSKQAAHDALSENIGAELGVDGMEAAHSVYAASVQDIVNGIKDVTIERGIDPRNYVLSGGGGAFGTVAAEVARELQISEVVLPRDAGVVCATGGLISDIRRDYSASQFTDSVNFDFDGVNDELEQLYDRAEQFFDRADIDEEDRSVSTFVEARYPGQIWELQVPAPEAPLTESDVEQLIEQYHEKHDQVFKFKQEDQEVEFLYWRVEAVGETAADVHTGEESATDSAADSPVDSSAVTPAETREAYFGTEPTEAPAYRATELAPGFSVAGPAFLDAENTTVVVPPETELTVTEHGNYHIAVDGW